MLLCLCFKEIEGGGWSGGALPGEKQQLRFCEKLSGESR